MNSADKIDRCVRVIITMLLYLSAALIVVFFCRIADVEFWKGASLYIFGLLVYKVAVVFEI